MPTLYYADGACSLAPHIALEWIGRPYEAVRVRYGSDELLAVNPAGAVPTLREDDGWLLTQAGAILDYLAHKHPEARLAGGDGARAKAEAHRWSAFFTSDVHAAFWPIFMPSRYTTDTSDERGGHWWRSSSPSSTGTSTDANISSTEDARSSMPMRSQ